jgi:hypothetical protein
MAKPTRYSFIFNKRVIPIEQLKDAYQHKYFKKTKMIFGNYQINAINLFNMQIEN